MKKRSKYRPRRVLLNTMAFVQESLTPVALHDTYLLDLKIVNSMAMASLMKGTATKRDMDALVAMSNIVEALYELGFGRQYQDVATEGRFSKAAHFVERQRGVAACTGGIEMTDKQPIAANAGEQKQSLNTQLANAVAAVASAQDYLGRMCELTARARNEETDARNKVNEAQKHFDELVALVKKSAPRNTDWTRAD